MQEKYPLKLLVVDDEPGIVDFVTRICSRKGFIAYGATDVADAIGIFEKERPHVCLIDVHIGHVPLGIVLLQSIKAIDKETCCVMFTHLGNDQRSTKDAKELGAYAYFLKPINEETIDKLLDEIKDKITGG